MHCVINQKMNSMRFNFGGKAMKKNLYLLILGLSVSGLQNFAFGDVGEEKCAWVPYLSNRETKSVEICATVSKENSQTATFSNPYWKATSDPIRAYGAAFGLRG